MKNLAFLENKTFGYILVIVLYAIYVAVSIVYYDEAGVAVAALSTIPVICAGWYFGALGGILVAVFMIASDIAIMISDGYSLISIFKNADTLIGVPSLIFIGWVVGSLGSMIRGGRKAITTLKKYELEHRAHANFL